MDGHPSKACLIAFEGSNFLWDVFLRLLVLLETCFAEGRQPDNAMG